MAEKLSTSAGHPEIIRKTATNSTSHPSTVGVPLVASPPVSIDTLCDSCKNARVGQNFTCIGRMKRHMAGKNIGVEKAQEIVNKEFAQCLACNPETCNARDELWDKNASSPAKEEEHSSTLQINLPASPTITAVPSHPNKTLPTILHLDALNQTGATNVTSLASANKTSTVSKNQTAWCVVSENSMWPGVNRWGWRKSAAHVAEALLPCWSYFRRTAASKCGLWIMDGLPNPHPWGAQLVDRMKCEIHKAERTPNGTWMYPNSTTMWREIPFQEEYWLDGQADAEALRHLVFPELNPRPQQLHIGILERLGTRKFTNTTLLVNAIKQAFGGGVKVHVQAFEKLSFQEQAEWFATKHIIVAVHGAALTNSVFLQPNTTVIQLFPLDYYFTGYFESLIAKAGGINMDWYAGNKSTALDVHKEMPRGRREYAKTRPFIDPPVEEIAQMVLNASKRYNNIM